MRRKAKGSPIKQFAAGAALTVAALWGGIQLMWMLGPGFEVRK